MITRNPRLTCNEYEYQLCSESRHQTAINNRGRGALGRSSHDLSRMNFIEMNHCRDAVAGFPHSAVRFDMPVIKLAVAWSLP